MEHSVQRGTIVRKTYRKTFRKKLPRSKLSMIEFYIIHYVVLSLGIPGNILSVIVWLRRHVTSQSSSAIYLASLAINDLVWLLSDCILRYGSEAFNHWLLRLCVRYLIESGTVLETLLVLSFSVVRLIAIRRPLQVRCIKHFDYKLKRSSTHTLVGITHAIRQVWEFWLPACQFRL